MNALVLFARRLHEYFWFLGRPVTGPVSGEVWSWWDHLRIRIGPIHAWEIACAMHPSAREQARRYAEIGEMLDRMRAAREAEPCD
jgi:hypothetical protein